jgi:hypothetical protein
MSSLKYNDFKTKRMPSLKGAITELAVAHKFLKKGYFVSKSLDPSCPFDLIITDDSGKCFLIDVKTISHRKKDNSIISRTLNQIQKEMNIKFYFTTIDGEEYGNNNQPRRRSRKI